MLEFYGEVNVPQKAIDDMLYAAGAKEEADGELRVKFTPEALQRATTRDVMKYNPSWDHSATTHFDDVFYGTKLHFATQGDNSVEDVNDTYSSKAGSQPKMTVRFFALGWFTYQL